MERQPTRIAIAQLNPTVNDFDGNQAKIIAAMEQAKQAGADMVITPELATVGYPADDLLKRRSTLEWSNEVVAAIQSTAAQLEISVLLGALTETDHQGKKPIYNSAVFIGPDGEILHTHHKSLLPTYNVFHEDRHFAEGSAEDMEVTTLRTGVPCGVTICEEVWADNSFWPESEYATDPVEILTNKGAKVIINLSASPYNLGKPGTRDEMLRHMAQERNATIIYANQVGANTELIFDGNSMVVSPSGDVVARGATWEEDLVFVDIDENGVPVQTEHIERSWAPEYKGDVDPKTLDQMAPEALDALTLGVRDYCRKCGFTKAVLGLSGGIDSAVTLAVAVRALGAENVTAVGMPSKFSSEGSVTEADFLARKLDVEFRVNPIEDIVDALRDQIGRVNDVADENLQARSRGTLLMGISNRENHILLTTGNKSELAVGYCTLYGDMNGGLAVISDCPKQLVYAMARAINAEEEIIPWNTINKPASAELAPDQKDSDSLPPYEILDRIVHEWVVNERTFSEISAMNLGIQEETLKWILRKIDITEFKRRQAAPGLRVTGKSFGKHDRWFPIAGQVRV
jgi:NAD+ synthase (glutamine-hydrolysing)